MLFKFIYLIGSVLCYPINYYCTNDSGVCLNNYYDYSNENISFVNVESIVPKKISMMIYLYDDYTSESSFYLKLDNIYRYIIEKKVLEDEDKIKKEFDSILFSDLEKDNNNYKLNDNNEGTNSDKVVNDSCENFFENVSLNLNFDEINNLQPIDLYKNINHYNIKDNIKTIFVLFNKIVVIYLKFIGIIVTSLLLSCFFVGHFVYSNMISNKKYLYVEDKEQDKKDFYELRFIEEYDNLDDEEITEEKLKSLEDNFISEETPRGLIHMSYDVEQEAFIYYAKSSSTFSYNYLDCVARQFVIKFNCKKLYYHLHDEIVKSYNRITKVSKNDNDEVKNEEASKDSVNLNNVRYSNTPDENEDDDVFANLKSYNKKTSNIQNNNKFDKKCNKFIFKGSLYDYDKKNKYNSLDNNVVLNNVTQNNFIENNDVENNNTIEHNNVSGGTQDNDLVDNDLLENNNSLKDNVIVQDNSELKYDAQFNFELLNKSDKLENKPVAKAEIQKNKSKQNKKQSIIKNISFKEFKKNIKSA